MLSSLNRAVSKLTKRKQKTNLTVLPQVEPGQDIVQTLLEAFKLKWEEIHDIKEQHSQACGVLRQILYEVPEWKSVIDTIEGCLDKVISMVEPITEQSYYETSQSYCETPSTLTRTPNFNQRCYETPQSDCETKTPHCKVTDKPKLKCQANLESLFIQDEMTGKLQDLLSLSRTISYLIQWISNDYQKETRSNLLMNRLQRITRKDSKISSNYSHYDQSKEQAATIIQSCWKGHYQRRRLRIMLQKKLIFGELLSSELNYLSSLAFVLQNYMIPSLELLTQEQYCTIFQVYEQMLYFHSRFTPNLAESILHKNQIGCIFIKHMPLFYDVYPKYIDNYHSMREQVNNVQKINVFQRHMHHIKHQCTSNGQTFYTLKELLICPIQRLPRYILLLDRLLIIDPKSEDYWMIKQAMQELDAIVR